tara:strand:- start:171 stop:365 length:195 start_codon:yes stop_codon:yes gene_type:complete
MLIAIVGDGCILLRREARIFIIDPRLSKKIFGRIYADAANRASILVTNNADSKVSHDLNDKNIL